MKVVVGRIAGPERPPPPLVSTHVTTTNTGLLREPAVIPADPEFGQPPIAKTTRAGPADSSSF